MDCTRGVVARSCKLQPARITVGEVIVIAIHQRRKGTASTAVAAGGTLVSWRCVSRFGYSACIVLFGNAHEHERDEIMILNIACIRKCAGGIGKSDDLLESRVTCS